VTRERQRSRECRQSAQYASLHARISEGWRKVPAPLPAADIIQT
jgi:hypothetical protein